MLVRDLAADLDTPITAYLKLRGEGASFLLESVEGGERVARYSFIGVWPQARYHIHQRQLYCDQAGHTRLIPGDDPLRALEAELARFPTLTTEGLPRLVGGLVGYLGYETVRYMEPVLDAALPSGPLPEALLLLTDTLVAFDHARNTMRLITHALDGDTAAAEARLNRLEERLRAPTPPMPTLATPAPATSTTTANYTQAEFEAAVRAAQEHIGCGDIFQVVLSQKFSQSLRAHPFAIYRALRRLNPSPYMFYFEFGEVHGEPLYLVGASPEMLVRFEARQRHMHVRPIAGTRPRGHTPAEDAALEKDLLADPKERAEHLMLVDLGRNDVGRVGVYGSVKVPDFFVVEHYSHVMHIVSQVTGTVRLGLTAFDVLRAAFPAGTLTGAPKVRAMQIIAALEPEPRGVYGGAVGYFSFDGSLDVCIAIRTLVAHGGTLAVQAGAGVVADSNPTGEYEETLNKARGVMKAIEAAEG